ncbi:MAG: hypothetical protein DRQ39_00495 [Gammaproteobacteria bacterium]|nr:MAG: hypothetical protein DRQ39_00495 [Gammaproteobacteria bacterium]RKZ94786.1 MAG: hypothetical protein DRQ40_05135 [Gammaproteobacteria bacterium]RKZ97903.1 MAG: hypothetical protein DRQ46_03620 [Gammaproteobacteria bacterium]RLA01011.1 MAG: hypothetical protein DRQ42_04205 [Gammaproteobacteria bacterium]
MQINGAQLATVISPKTSEFQEKGRSPITIDVKPNVESAEKASHQATNALNLYQQAITTYEDQQTRFVRLLATTDTEQQSNNRHGTQSDHLPQGVQQYLQIAGSVTEPQQSLFDEVV